MQTHIITDTHMSLLRGLTISAKTLGCLCFSFKFYGAPYAPKKNGRQSALESSKLTWNVKMYYKEIQGRLGSPGLYM